MKKVQLAVASVFLAAVFGGAAFAAESFTLDDSAFDYFEDEAYLRLEYADGDFLIHLENEVSDGALELADTEVELPTGQSSRDNLTDAQLAASIGLDVEDDSADITLESNDLQAAIESYDAQMEALGFEGEIEAEASGANRTVKIYDTGETQTRVVFTRRGDDIGIYMHSL